MLTSPFGLRLLKGWGEWWQEQASRQTVLYRDDQRILFQHPNGAEVTYVFVPRAIAVVEDAKNLSSLLAFLQKGTGQLSLPDSVYKSWLDGDHVEFEWSITFEDFSHELRSTIHRTVDMVRDSMPVEMWKTFCAVATRLEP